MKARWLPARVQGCLLLAVGLGVWSTGCGTVAQGPAPASANPSSVTSFLQARRTVLAAVESEGYAIYAGGHLFSSRHARIAVQVTERNLVISHPGETRNAVVEWRDLRPVTGGRFAGSAYASDSGTGVNPGMTGARLHIYLKNEQTAQSLAAALNWLAEEARGAHEEEHRVALTAFQTGAAFWRDLKTKPPLSAEADRQRVLAEHAVAARHYDEALEHYETGLAVAPFWPEGHYNAAVLYSEMEAYRHAVGHLQRYLELSPDAPDAGAAHEKLIIWQEKSK